MNHRKSVEKLLDDVKSAARHPLRDKSIGDLFIGWVASGIEMARVRDRLFCGTAGTRCCDVKGDGQEKKIEAQSTETQSGDGPTGISVEGSVMDLERRSRADLLS